MLLKTISKKQFLLNYSDEKGSQLFFAQYNRILFPYRSRLFRFPEDSFKDNLQPLHIRIIVVIRNHRKIIAFNCICIISNLPFGFLLYFTAISASSCKRYMLFPGHQTSCFPWTSLCNPTADRTEAWRPG